MLPKRAAFSLRTSLLALNLITCVAACTRQPDFHNLVTPKSPGLAVTVRRNGRTVSQRGYGVRELRSFRRIDAETNFRLASVTKQFTAMAIMLLVHDNKLRYDEPITDIFPEFPSYGRSITIRHLLTHTSGLPDYEELMEKQSGQHWSADYQIRDREVLTLLEKQSNGKFQPGTSWAYSNSGYVLLGLIAAQSAGQPFDELLRDRIFNPLGMTHTVVFIEGKNSVKNRAYGHTKEGDTFIETDQSATSATLGDGGIYSNLDDLAKWDDALANHTLLSADGMRPALTAVSLSDGSQPHWPAAGNDDNLAPGKPVSYGFGWFLDPYRGRPRMWHAGGTMGFRTVIDRFTHDNVTIVVLCNRTDLDPALLALDIL